MSITHEVGELTAVKDRRMNNACGTNGALLNGQYTCGRSPRRKKEKEAKSLL